jgi:hypothetical protein
MLGKLSFTDKIVSKRLGIDQETVSGVTGFFVKELDAEFRKADHAFIYVRGLGTFTLVLGAIETRLKTIIGRYWLMRNDPEVLKCNKNLLGLRRLCFELFALRRTIKDKRKEIKLVKDERKAINDNKG